MKDEKHSILAGVSSAMPSLLEAHKLSSRAAQAGFDWPNVEGLFDKLKRRNRRTARAAQRISRARTASPGPRRGRIWANSRPRRLFKRDLKKKSATCSSCWSISRAIFRSIPNPRCAKPTASSSAAFSGWKPASTNRAAPPIRLLWRNWNRCGSKPKRRESTEKPA